jgi:CBS domain-containing protein
MLGSKAVRVRGGADMSRAESRTDVTTLPVVELMSHPVFCVTSPTRLGDALVLMLRTGLRHLVVVDDEQRCRGVVADRAVTAAWAADPSSLVWQCVGGLLDPRPAVVGADATVADAARLMFADRIDATAVIDRYGRPVGVVTGGDLVSLMATYVAPPRDTAEEDAPTDDVAADA